MTDSERGEIISGLCLLRDKLEKNRQLFDLAESDAETEALIYEQKALMLRYSELFRRAKAAGAANNEKETVVNDGDNIHCGGGADND